MSFPQALLDFLSQADRLKEVERRNLLHSGLRRENTAEHSWHLALAVLTGKDLANEPINLERALKMALLHDLPETEVGDTFLYDSAGATGQVFREEVALTQMLKPLGEKLAIELFDVWKDFEDRRCPESRFVRAWDRFLALQANYKTQGSTWKQYGIKKHQVLEKNGRLIEEGSRALWLEAQKLIESAVLLGYLSET